MKSVTPFLRCAHCHRVISKDTVSAFGGRRVHVVCKGMHDDRSRTIDAVYLVCEGDCDRALRRVVPRPNLSDLPSDFVMNGPVSFEEWETLTDIATYPGEWIARMAQRVRSGEVPEDGAALLRSIARLVKELALDRTPIEKMAS